VTDAAVLSQHVGGVVVVVGAQKLRHADLQKSTDALKLVGSNILGVVLNRLPAKGPDAYSYSYYSNREDIGSAPDVFSRTGKPELDGFERALRQPMTRAAGLFPNRNDRT
jgi:Mrp family chromosome partitioning ATPase